MIEPKPYPGIPAGILDEDLEEYMSKKKGPFDSAIKLLGGYGGIITTKAERECDAAIRVLEALPERGKEGK